MVRAKKTTKRTYEFVAETKWGSSDDLPADRVSSLPTDFAEARKHWIESTVRAARASDRALAKACRIIEKYVCCYFRPGELRADVSSLLGCNGDVKANHVSVCGVCFGDNRGRTFNLPQIRATARFTFEPAVRLSEEVVAKWEADNDADLYGGMIFYWDIPMTDGDSFDRAMFESRGGDFWYAGEVRGAARAKKHAQQNMPAERVITRPLISAVRPGAGQSNNPCRGRRRRPFGRGT